MKINFAAFLKRMGHFSLTLQLLIHVLTVLANQSSEKLFVMDNNSLKQVIERILELKFRYSGSFQVDSFPSLTKISFAIIKISPSSEAGKHWIMTAWLNRAILLF